MAIRTVIIEDEGFALNALQLSLEENCPEVEVVGVARNVVEAHKVISEQRPDLVLSDIDLEGKTVFDLLDRLKLIDFKLIFVTGHDTYALKALKLSAIDYLLKPFEDLDLINAVQKAKEALNTEDQAKQLQYFQDQSNESKPTSIVLKSTERLQLVKIEDIISIEADGSYSLVHLLSGEDMVISKNLKDFESRLKGYSFFRTHQSHLINLNHFSEFVKSDGGYIKMNNGKQVPLARSAKSEFFQVIESI